jgi:hypothetical protein
MNYFVLILDFLFSIWCAGLLFVLILLAFSKKFRFILIDYLKKIH